MSEIKKNQVEELSDDALENAAGGIDTPMITDLPETTAPSTRPSGRPSSRPGSTGNQNNDN